MPRNPTRRFPIASFGPELFNALVTGSRRKIEIELQTFRQGVKFQQRIQMLRKAMREENHPLSTVVTRARCSLIYGEAAGYPKCEETTTQRGNKFPVDRNVRCKIVIAPQDSEFREAVLGAGITESDLRSNDVLGTSPPISNPDLPPERGGDYLDDFLPELDKKHPKL